MVLFTCLFVVAFGYTLRVSLVGTSVLWNCLFVSILLVCMLLMFCVLCFVYGFCVYLIVFVLLWVVFTYDFDGVNLLLRFGWIADVLIALLINFRYVSFELMFKDDWGVCYFGCLVSLDLLLVCLVLLFYYVFDCFIVYIILILGCDLFVLAGLAFCYIDFGGNFCLCFY